MPYEISSPDSYPMDKLLAKLSEQEAVLNQQHAALKTNDDNIYARTLDNHNMSSSSSLPITPATDTFPTTAPTTRPASVNLNESRSKDEELLRLKLELAQAQNRISHLSNELTHRGGKQEEPATAVFNNLRLVQPIPRGNTNWPTLDDAQSEISDTMSTNTGFAGRPIWPGTRKGPMPVYSEPLQPQQPAGGDEWLRPQPYQGGFVESGAPYGMMDGYRSERATPDPDHLMRPVGGRRNPRFDTQFDARCGPRPGGWNNYRPPTFTHCDGMNMTPMVGGPTSMTPGPMTTGTFSPFSTPALGTPLSPHATEFTSAGPWKSEVRLISSVFFDSSMLMYLQAIATDGQTYLPTTEPLNYRKLLDRNVNCNWKYIVDKIVCNNDQQASIFLQQKLKVGTPEQKYQIVEGIVAQAYPLMVNRFGNFLVQRCFEHGTPEQVVKIAEAIRGNTLSLSMDPFGCHVVQKAFDSVPEDYKAIMVEELLRRIPETVIHRYACHVWQKLFELRWTESPPQIMKYVNDALSGMWHEVALGETGSLVVQNIFENCLEEDKASLFAALFSHLLTELATLHRGGPRQY